MTTYFLDDDFRPWAVQAADGSRTPWTDADGLLDGLCDAYRRGLRVIPAGETYTRADGAVFHGLMIAPATDAQALDAAQRAYQQASDEMAARTAALESSLMDVAELTLDHAIQLAQAAQGGQ